MPFHISFLKHPLWQMAEDSKVKDGILNAKLLNIWKAFLKRRRRKKSKQIQVSFALFHINMTKYTSLQVSQGDFDFDRIYHRRRHSSFPCYTCTDDLFATPSGNEQPVGDGSHQHAHKHHLCRSQANERSKQGLARDWQ